MTTYITPVTGFTIPPTAANMSIYKAAPGCRDRRRQASRLTYYLLRHQYHSISTMPPRCITQLSSRAIQRIGRRRDKSKRSMKIAAIVRKVDKFQNEPENQTKRKKTEMKSNCSLTLMVAISTLCTSSTRLRASETDDRIEASAKKSYVFKTYLSDDSIKTKSKDGAVTLTGTVSETSHKALAENTVEDLPGVKSVDNQLKIKGEPEEHSDAWVGVKVKSALLFHHNVRATKTDVNVTDGKVTLSGEANSMA